MWSQRDSAVAPVDVASPPGGPIYAASAPKLRVVSGCIHSSAGSTIDDSNDAPFAELPECEPATAAEVQTASSELTMLTATRLHPLWGTFRGGGEHGALELEFLAFRWRAACPTILKLSVAFNCFWIFTAMSSAQSVKVGWIAVVSLGVIFNTAFAIITWRRWSAFPRSCWAVFAFGNACLGIAATMYSRTLSLASGAFTSLHRPQAHAECGLDLEDPFIRWQVAHAAFFINSMNVSVIFFTRMPFAQGLCLTVMCTVGLVIAMDHAYSGLGATCWPFNMTYVFPAALMMLCTLFVSRTGEIEHRLAYVQRKINSHNSVLVRDAQHRLVCVTKAAAQADASKRAHLRFLATFSHELRTPLTAIMGNLENLQSLTPKCSHDCCDNTENDVTDMRNDSDSMAVADMTQGARAKYVGRALSSSHLLLSLVNNILDLSRLEANAFMLDQRDFSVHDMLHRVKDVVHTVAEAKQLRVSFALGADVPAVVHGDGTRFQQILLNFAANACKFTPPHGCVGIDVDIIANSTIGTTATSQPYNLDINTGESAGAGDRIKIRATVRDSGIGLPPSQLERIWDMFYQHHSPNEGVDNMTGAGCGLAICKQLARLMGGDVSVTSELGNGSTFTATAVFKEAQHTANSPTSAAQPDRQFEHHEVKSVRRTHHAHRVLLAEDNVFNAEVISDMLNGTCEVVVATNGAEAVNTFTDAASRGEGFSLVLMDCNMPQMDGFAATRAIRKWEIENGYQCVSSDTGSTPVVALTAHGEGDRSVRQQCEAAGMRSFISKPVQRDDLIRHVQRMLDAQGGNM